MTDLMVSLKYEKRTNASCAWMHMHATDTREATERGKAVGPCLGASTSTQAAS